MPTDTVIVDRIDWTLLDEGVKRYLVSGWHADPTILGGFAASTTNQWAASLCEQARKTHQPIRIQWIGFDAGEKRIKQVEPVTPEEQSA